MDKIIIPLVITIFSFVIIRSLNPEINALGGVIALVVGAIAGTLINKLVAKNDARKMQKKTEAEKE